MKGIPLLVPALLLSWPVSAVAQVDCDRQPSGAVQRAIKAARPGKTIFVSGTCHENVTLPVGKDSITLDGGGAATIHGVDATQPTILVNGRQTTIKGFTITGGQDGIVVSRGGWAVIDSNTIRNAGRNGIDVTQIGFAVIVNNTVQENRNAGIAVGLQSSAWIGFVSETDTVASPNLVSGNGAQGIVVLRGATARIAGNDVSNNAANGVRVAEASYAQISDNTINGNGTNGIFVQQGSSVTLGAGALLFSRRNSTTINNLGFGILCQVGGIADGRLGSLNGESGVESYSEGCVGSLIP
jgi:hypothetical protein